MQLPQKVQQEIKTIQKNQDATIGIIKNGCYPRFLETERISVNLSDNAIDRNQYNTWY